jgi:hypothetical protein
MSRLTDVLARARATLADPNKQRWSDARLLELLDEGQKQMALEASLLHEVAPVSIPVLTAEFNLPADCYRITRLEVLGRNIPLVSHEEMDALFRTTASAQWSWAQAVGTTIEKVVYDKTKVKQLKVYPLQLIGSADISAVQVAPSSAVQASIMSSLFGVVVDSGGPADELLQLNGVVADILYTWVFDTATGSYSVITSGLLPSPFGVVTGISDDLQTSTPGDTLFGLTVGVELYQLTSVFGFVVDASPEFETSYLDDSGVVTPTPYGVTLGILDTATPLMVHYIRYPATLTLAGELEIDQVHDTALKYYVVAAALQDDQDTQNSAMADKYLSLFAGLLMGAKSAMQKSLTKTGTQYATPFRTGFE